MTSEGVQCTRRYGTVCGAVAVRWRRIAAFYIIMYQPSAADERAASCRGKAGRSLYRRPTGLAKLQGVKGVYTRTIELIDR